MALDAGDLVVDVGRGRGAVDGQRVELWRPLKIRHPVTGRTLTDRFRIGTVRLTQVQTTMSLGRPEGTLTREPAPGDVVVLPQAAGPREGEPSAATGKTDASRPAPPREPATPLPPSPAPAPATATVIVSDPEERALAELMMSLEGSDPSARVAAYEAFVRAHPGSRFVGTLREEIVALRTVPKKEDAVDRPEPLVRRLRPGIPQDYAIELDRRFVGAVVHVRRKGSAPYSSVPMRNVGTTYWTATLPGDAIAQPGLQYFTEGVTSDGRAVAIAGTAERPRDVAVDPHPLTGKNPATLAQVSLQSEYASFNARKANDWLFQTEGSFAWRLADEGVRAVRSGFGVLRGKGGSLRDLDELGRAPTDVGLTYGYLELEVAPSTRYAILFRPILGLREGGIAGGAQGFLRVGHDLRTNLVVGGEVLGTVGLRGIVQLDWRTIRRVPVVLRTEVTTQPAGAGSDVGARAIAQVGYELTKELTVGARVSYQGRTINHAGPGAGLAVSYLW